MRKAVKEKLVQLMDSVREGIVRLYNISREQYLEVLSDMQNAVVVIGETIESSEDDKGQLIGRLERFAENLYGLYLAAEQEEDIGEKIEVLVKQSEEIHKKLEEEIQETFEIVFMPYKASMWDAMESIYHAVMKDPAYKAVVVPIPYYNIGKDREILSIEYEGDMFPKEVVITDYCQYNLAEMYPDVIFIHNPYDEYNNVTQVKEEYFASRLSKYTNHLTYVPYKVCSGVEKDIYCVMPGVYYSWRTFVQSERVRSVYLKYHKPEKIVALGSPKVDRVVNLKKEDFYIPDIWEEAIKGRKVFLLNTHLNNIINHGELVLNKLRRVFNIFRERKDIALIWRPHPLSIQTIKSMNSQIMEDYLSIVNEFKQLKNGIYDDTVDMHRAIALSNAYIGDHSSLVSLYGVTKKPIMILGIHADNRSLLERNIEQIRWGATAIDEQNMYFCARDFKEIFRYHIETDTLIYIGNIEISLNCEIIKMSKWDDKLFFVTKGEKTRCNIYDLNSEECRQVSIGNDWTKEEDIKCIQWKERLYIFSENTTCFGYMDMSSEKYIEKHCFTERIQIENAKIKDVVISGDMVYVLIRNSNIIIKYDILKELWYTLDFRQLKDNIVKIAYGDANLFFCTETSHIYTFDEKIQVLSQYREINIGKEELETLQWFVHGADMWMILSSRRELLCLNCATKELISLEYSDEVEFDSDVIFPLSSRFSTFDIKNNKLWLHPYMANRLLEIDLSRKQMVERQIGLTNNLKEEYLISSFRRRKLRSVYYEQLCGIEYYINLVLNSDDFLKDSREQEFNAIFGNIGGTAGEEIWSYIKKSL